MKVFGATAIVLGLYACLTGGLPGSEVVTSAWWGVVLEALGFVVLVSIEASEPRGPRAG